MPNNSLTGKTPANTYKDLLHLNNDNEGADGTVRNLRTGDGEELGIKIAIDKIEIDCNEGVIDTPIVQNLATKAVVADEFTTSAPSELMSVPINLNNGNVFHVTLNPAFTLPMVTFTVTVGHSASNNPALEFTLIIDRQDTFTYSSVTWPSGTLWPGGDDATDDVFNNAGTSGTQTAGVHIIKFLSVDAGSTWYAWIVGGFFA